MHPYSYMYCAPHRDGVLQFYNCIYLFININFYTYLYTNMLQKTFVKSLFWISIKTFTIEVLQVKTFWLETLLKKALSN